MQNTNQGLQTPNKSASALVNKSLPRMPQKTFAGQKHVKTHEIICALLDDDICEGLK